MAKKQEKRLAHELILRQIEEWYKDADPNLITRSIIKMLCYLMEEIVIPKEHLVEIIDKLEKINKLSDFEKFDKTPINCLIEDLQHRKKKLICELFLEAIEYYYTQSRIVDGLGSKIVKCYLETIEHFCNVMKNMVLFSKTKEKEELDHIVSKLRKIKKLPHNKLLDDCPINSLIKHFLRQKKALSS